MAFKKIPLTIDTMIRNPVPVEGINQEDNVELNIVVTENKTPKDLSGQTIKVYVRRIDGTLVEQTNQITPTNARKGEVTVKLKNSAFNKEGYALFQLDVSDSIGRITSSYATFKIGKGLVSGEAIANTNEINALKQIEEYVTKANEELETFKQTVSEINENEAIRQRNESTREENEEVRKQEFKKIKKERWIDNKNILYKTISANKTDFIKIKSGNLMQLYDLENGKAVNTDTGELYDLSSYTTTDFIEITPETKYVFSGNTNICFYDETKSFVKGNRGGSWSSPYTTPAGVKYLRWSVPTRDIQNSSIKLFGSENSDLTMEFNELLNDSIKNFLKNDKSFNIFLKGLSLTNKKINILGDSISSLDYLRPNWCEQISEKTGVTFNNYGVSGTTIAFNENRENTAGKCFANRVNELTDGDCTIIMGGTNDVNSNIPLGEWGDETNTTLYGAINIIITTLLNKFPGKPIIWCAPIQDRNSCKNKPLPDVQETVLTASSKANVNYPLLIGAIRLKCRQYSIPFINLYDESGINGYDTDFIYYRSNDTVHPSVLGHTRIACQIQNELEKIFK